jgi:hypothetical protein
VDIPTIAPDVPGVASADPLLGESVTPAQDPVADQPAAATPSPPASRTSIPQVAGTAPSTADQATLEVRIARLEALVERLIAEQERSRALAPGRPGRLPGAAQNVLPPSARRRPALSAVLSPDGKLTAELRSRDDSTIIDILDSDSGRIMSRSELDGRAMGIQFTPDGQRLGILLPGQERFLDVPSGRLLDATQAELDPTPALTDAEPARQSPALTGYLREWNPERRLLEIDLQQAELQLQAAKRKLAALQELRESKVIPASEVDQQEIEVRQAELNVVRVQTQLELHQSKRTAFEEELSRNRLSTRRKGEDSHRELENSLRTYPAGPRPGKRPPEVEPGEAAPEDAP